MLIGILILILFALNYKFVNNAVIEFVNDYEEVNVERIIDGDTIVVGNNTHVRLLGINTPEKGEEYYSEARNFLESIILNKTVRLEYGKEKYDRYGRELAYVIYKGKNVNLEIVDEGYANFYFPSGKDKYYSQFMKNWKHCIGNNKYLCEKSDDKCSECIELKLFDYKNQEIVFYNKCNFECSMKEWTIKDEGRKKFSFENFVLGKNGEVKIALGNGTNSKDILFWKRKDYVWTLTGDTLFLRDEKGRLVLWGSY